MSSLEIALIAFACLLGGSLPGMALRGALPGHHLSDDSRNPLAMGLGIVGTMAGLVLGLLVGSASGAYTTQRNELLDVSSKVVMLDRILAHYGPEAKAPRRALRVAVQRTLVRIWPNERSSTAELDPSAVGAEGLFDKLEALNPRNDEQSSLKPQAVGLAINLGQVRWLMYEQSESAVSVPLVVVLVFWFTITFVGFGLFSPPNATVVVALTLCALAVSGAILVMLEMYTPFEGRLVQLSSTPLRDALMHLGQ